MNRIENTFETLKTQGKTALIPFVMCGDGDTSAVLDGLVAGGADIIELGIPFSDPTADGATIQAAGLRALEGGMTLAKVLDVAKAFRARHANVPLVLMGYYNPIFHMQTEKFCAAAAASGVDGVIVVDLPPEEEAELTVPLTKHGLHMVRLIAPTSLENRLPLLVKNASGYIYYIAIAGITGAKGAVASDVAAAVAKIREHTRLPVAVGFGIKTAIDAAALKTAADGVVVGSSLVDGMNKSENAAQTALNMMQEFKKVL
jgi:tryptophan synthase alpha chain